MKLETDFYMQLKALVCPQALRVYSNPTSYTHIIKWFPTLVWGWNKNCNVLNYSHSQQTLIISVCVVVGRGLWEVRAHADWGFNMGGWPMFKVAHNLDWKHLSLKAIKVLQKLVCSKQSALYAVTEQTPWPACIWWWLIPDLSTQSPYIRLSPQKHKESKPGSLKASGCLNNA